MHVTTLYRSRGQRCDQEFDKGSWAVSPLIVLEPVLPGACSVLQFFASHMQLP